MGKNLEEATPVVEEAKPTSEEKGAEPTTSKAEPTIRTYTQKELDVAVGKGRSTTQSQLLLAETAVSSAKADADASKASVAALTAQMQVMEKEIEEALVDDPDRRKVYISRMAGLEREQKVAKREAEAEAKVYAAELKEHDLAMALRAKELMEETGIPLAQLEGSLTQEELEIKALRFKVAQEPEVKKPEETPQFDSGVSSGGGRSFKQIEEAYGKGLVSTPEYEKALKEQGKI